MSVGVLLITHGSLGSELLRIATGIFGTCPTRADALEVENDAPCDPLLEEAQRRVNGLDEGDGVLVLTDFYGSTPANLAVDLGQRHPRVRVLAGVNLPMLVRALSYASLDLDQTADKALQGGREGVLRCAPRPDEA
ncbi:MAG: PTS sugar transporter subunit IIA [Bdellovibrio bacteriovorus]